MSAAMGLAIPKTGYADQAAALLALCAAFIAALAPACGAELPITIADSIADEAAAAHHAGK